MINRPGAVSLSADLSSALIARLLSDAPDVLEALVSDADYIFGNTQEITLAEHSGLEIRRRPGLEVIETRGSQGGILHKNAPGTAKIASSHSALLECDRDRVTAVVQALDRIR